MITTQNDILMYKCDDLGNYKSVSLTEILVAYCNSWYETQLIQIKRKNNIIDANQPGKSYHANLEIWLTNRIESNYSFHKVFDLVPHNLNHMKWKSCILNAFKTH